MIGILPSIAAAQVAPASGTRRGCPISSDLPEADRLACEQITASLEQFAEEGEALGRKAATIIQEVSRRTVQRGSQTFDRIAIENPLDANGGNEGERAWQEYAEDSRLLLNDTFMGCLEPREVRNHPEYNPICRAICPRFVQVAPGCPRCRPDEPPPFPGAPPCVEQRHIVVEHYLPVYQIAANKAGARSLDVQMFREYDNAPELTRSSTQQHQEEVDKVGITESLEALGLPTERIKWPAWHRPGTEPFLQGNNESFEVNEPAQSFSIAYQTNLHAQATRDRPPQFWEGFLENPKSGLWCFNDPGKKIVANSMDHGEGVYSLLSRAAEFTAIAWPEAYEATVNLPWNLAETGQRAQLPQDTIPSFRSRQWPQPFQELKRVGVQPGGDSRHKDWIFFGGTLAPFNVSRFDTFTDPVRADIFRNATAALLFGSRLLSLAPANTYKRRLLQFSLYRERQGEAREGYTGRFPSVEDPIVFVDKLQLIYPPIRDGERRKGTECFRIENMPNNEPGGRSGDDHLGTTSTGHIEIPKDLRKQFLEGGIEELNRANETRVAVWTKRIVCACERCGRPFGCTTLNNGDFEEDSFAGNSREFTTPPPPFEQLMPFLNGYAEKKTPPRLQLPQLDLLNRPVGADDGRTGPTPGETPPEIEVKPGPFVFAPFIFPFCRTSDALTNSTRAVPRKKIEVYRMLREEAAQSRSAKRLKLSLVPHVTLNNCTANGCEVEHPRAAEKHTVRHCTLAHDSLQIDCGIGHRADATLFRYGPQPTGGNFYQSLADELAQVHEAANEILGEEKENEYEEDDDDDGPSQGNGSSGSGGSSIAVLVGCRTLPAGAREAIHAVAEGRSVQPRAVGAARTNATTPLPPAKTLSEYRF